MKEIAEADWKVWRKISEIAYERFCEQTLNRVIKVANSKEDAFERYDKVHAILKDADKKLENAFGPVRRSTALQQLAYAVAEGMISREELLQFSEDAQQTVSLWLRE